MTVPEEPDRLDPVPSTSTEPVVDSPAGAAEAAAATPATEVPAAGPAPAAPTAPAPRHGGLRGVLEGFVATLHRIPHPPARSKRGLFIGAVLVAGFGVTLAVGGVVAIGWTETADFCGRCHTMDPELKAYEVSPHREVTCAECHVEPGITGWVKAKIAGTRQLVEVMLNTYPTPILPPNHDELPSTQDTCVKCHDVEALIRKGGPVRLKLNSRYQKDEPNTRDLVAVVLRPAGFGGDSGTRGVHWHIDSDVEYLSADPRAQTIDFVEVTSPDGAKEQFIAARAVNVSTDVQPDIDHMLSTTEPRRVDCITCHNRVGHGTPGVDQAIDDSIDVDAVSQSLPYVKRESSTILKTEYASVADGHAAIDGLRGFYEAQYPLVAKGDAGTIDRAIDSLKVTYDLIATPAMRVTPTTYPNNLGHQTAPGCFRCHDGAHYKVVDGALTNETIPASCATCHTYPQIGSTESGVMIGQRPESHGDRLWVFNHKSEATSSDPTGTTCGACHTRTYCENCHSTSVAKVSHEDMMLNHGNISREVGVATCAYCHQPSYCAQCHAEKVMPDPYGQDAPLNELYPIASPSAAPSAAP
jgi:hypothetical protein